MKHQTFLKAIMNLFISISIFIVTSTLSASIPLYWWQPNNNTTNFGDTLSVVLIERMIGKPVRRAHFSEHKLLAIGSILHFARNGDVIWGSGINGKHLQIEDYFFQHLDVRSVRGPLTRLFLKGYGIDVPEVYGDPALLFPKFFPEFVKNPINEYVIIPHISEIELFQMNQNVVLPTESWDIVVQKIVESKFVISSSLHGIVIAEAFGIPARLLRITENEPLFKYTDYYFGTGRRKFRYAKSIEEAFQMGGEPLPICNLQKLLDSFPSTLF